MSNLLVLGVGPLPGDPGDRLFATGLRVDQIATVLVKAGHKVTLVASNFGDFSGAYESVRVTYDRQNMGMPPTAGAFANLDIRRVPYHPQRTLETLSTLVLTGRFDGIVSTTDIMNDLSARLPSRLPRWMDFFGDPFAEKQMQAATHDHDGSLRLQWPLYFSALAAGDRFSVCSTSQAHAMTGQLAFAGRLNGATDGERLVHVLKPSSRAMLELEKRQGPQVRPVSLTVPTEAFKVLWTGGYNTWADVDTLFAGLEMAMSRNSRIHFVSTGGAIAGHDNRTANRFQALIANSEHRDRYHFLGWVQTRDIPYIYRLADVAVNVDRPCYEGELGTRNRLIDWMLFEVPIVTTVSCDLARELGERGLVNAVNCGDGAGLAEALDQVAADPSAAKARAKFAKDWFEQAHQESQSFQPLLTWAANPVRAGDQPTDSPNAPPTVVSHPLGAVGEVKSLLSQRHLRALAGPQRKSLIRRVLGRLLGR